MSKKFGEWCWYEMNEKKPDNDCYVYIYNKLTDKISIRYYTNNCISELHLKDFMWYYVFIPDNPKLKEEEMKSKIVGELARDFEEIRNKFILFMLDNDFEDDDIITTLNTRYEDLLVTRKFYGLSKQNDDE